jgi:RNA polymerase sigma factor (sigma-70 family)
MVLIEISREKADAPASYGPPSFRLAGDDELLDWFLGEDASGSEAAFSELVDRHGPIILGICRRVLGRSDEAEDAFQATFLALARAAGSIRERRAVGCWLCEVAYRVALRARSRAAEREAREREAAEMTGERYDHDRDPAWDDLLSVLREEINRLPSPYRKAVVLCYLEGRTNQEAAALLRWPVGTVKGRLYRARHRLRSRLARRGLALSAALLLFWLRGDSALAKSLPPSLAQATIQLALTASRDLAADALDAPSPPPFDPVGEVCHPERPARASGCHHAR